MCTRAPDHALVPTLEGDPVSAEVEDRIAMLVREINNHNNLCKHPIRKGPILALIRLSPISRFPIHVKLAKVMAIVLHKLLT